MKICRRVELILINNKLQKENTELKQQIECEIANNSLTLERLAITEEEYEEEIKELKKKIEDIPIKEKIDCYDKEGNILGDDNEK